MQRATTTRRMPFGVAGSLDNKSSAFASGEAEERIVSDQGRQSIRRISPAVTYCAYIDIIIAGLVIVGVSSTSSQYLSSRGSTRIERESREGRNMGSLVLLLLLCGASSAMPWPALPVARCAPDNIDELIWDYEVRRPQRIGDYQEVEAEYGPTDARITCIKFNSMSKDNDAAWVTAGGLGHDFVKIKFRSKYSQGMHFRVFVYGRSMSSTLNGGELRLF